MKKIVFFIIFLIVFIVIFALIYYFFEDPIKNQEISFVNLNLYALNSETNNQEITGYRIYVDGILYNEGITEKNSAVLQKVPLNKSILIHNYNLENQTYCLDVKNISTFNDVSDKKYRINLLLTFPKKFRIKQFNYIGNSSYVDLNLTSESFVKNSIFCLYWTRHFIFAEIRNESFVKVDKINGADKCFLFGDTNENEEIELKVYYKIIGELEGDDKIDLIIYDEDKQPFSSEVFRHEIQKYEIE